MRLRSLVFVLAPMILSSCGGDDGPAGTRDAGAGGLDAGPGRDAGPGPGGAPLDGLYTAEVDEIVVEVDFETGAAPYTGTTLTSGDPWELFRVNMEALFATHPRTITFPSTPAGMEEIGDVTGQDHDVDAIIAVAGAHRDQPSTRARRSYYVVFLDGWYSEGGERQTNVLGVSIGTTGVIAMFKPVIAGTGGLTSDTPRFVEQTTLIHELGHALGFVNNGVPMVTPHQDEPHGRHCTNSDCVMYWLNESASDVVGFVTRQLGSGPTVLFGDECLDDAAAAAAGR